MICFYRKKIEGRKRAKKDWNGKRGCLGRLGFSQKNPIAQDKSPKKKLLSYFMDL